MTEKLSKAAQFVIVNILAALIVLIIKTIVRKSWELIKKVARRDRTQVATAQS